MSLATIMLKDGTVVLGGDVPDKATRAEAIRLGFSGERIITPLTYETASEARRVMQIFHSVPGRPFMEFPVRLHRPAGSEVWYLATSPTPLEEAAARVPDHVAGEFYEGLERPLPATETTSDNRERLLYDALEAIGTLSQLLREERSGFLKRKGAELVELWRRGENLGVQKGERP